MNRTLSTELDRFDDSLHRAEQDVQESLKRFEVAMDHLAEKVEGPGEMIHKVQMTARKAKSKFQHVADVVQDIKRSALESFQQGVVLPMVPYLKRGQVLSNKAVAHVRRNPRTYLLVAVGVAGGVAAYLYWRKHQKSHFKFATRW